MRIFCRAENHHASQNEEECPHNGITIACRKRLLFYFYLFWICLTGAV
jgi:hypothetical protein